MSEEPGMRPVARGRVFACLVLSGCSRSQPAPESPARAEPRAVHPRVSFDTGIEGGATAVAVSADGRLVLVQGPGQAGNVQVWDAGKKRKVRAFDNPSGSVLPVALTRDGKTAAGGTPDGVVLLEVDTGKELHRLPASGLPHGLHFSPRGDLLVAGAGGQVVGWDPTTGKKRFAWDAGGEVTALSPFFAGGGRFASGGAKGTIRIWDVAS